MADVPVCSSNWSFYFFVDLYVEEFAILFFSSFFEVI